MKRLLFPFAATLVGVIGVACSDGAPPVADTFDPDGSPATNQPPSTSSDAATSDKDAETDGDAATSHLDGGADTDADAAPWVPGPSLCKANMTLGAPSTVVSTNGDDRFSAITRDELTIAWVIPSDTSVGTLQIADRASTGDAFGAPHSPAGTVALDGVSLTPDGLTLLAIGTNRREFLVFKRIDRTEAFVAADASHYAKLVAALAPQEKVGDPVFATDEQRIVYSVYGGSSNDTVRYATRLSLSTAFDVGGAYAYAELRTENGKRRRPTGMDRDFETMFYWDEVSQTEKLGRMQGTAAVGFYAVHDVGARPSAQPNEDCSRIYYGAAGAGGNDVVAASVQ